MWSTLRMHVRYRFDTLLARGTWAVLLWLGGVTLAAVVIASASLWISGVEFAGSESGSWPEDVWQSLLRVLDPGTMASDTGWGPRALALSVTIFGILVAGTLIGLIANGVEQRVEAMRRGRSTVMESDHVVVLGSSARLPVVVGNLALDNRTQRSRTIVILADREPVELAEDVQAAVGDLHGSRLVVRRGDPTRADDLEMVAVRRARAIIVLADDDGGNGRVVTHVLSVHAVLDPGSSVPIVAEIGEPGVAAALERATGPSVHTVVTDQSNGRIAAFALRENGLSEVVLELLAHRGAEIHVRPVGDLAGTAFGETVLRCTEVRPIGRIRRDGGIDLNPRPETVLNDEERLIVIADDSAAAARLQRAARAPTVAWHPPPPPDDLPYHVRLLGWNKLGSRLLSSLDEIAAADSIVDIVFDARRLTRDDIVVPALRTVEVTVQPAGHEIWQLPDDTDTCGLTAIVLLAQPTQRPADADGETLLNHLLLRRELDRRGGTSPNVLVELIAAANVDLARQAGASDVIVSDALTSGLMTQLAGLPERRPILLRLYHPGGPSLRLLRAAELGLVGSRDGRDVIATTYRAGLLAIGWRTVTGVTLNPPVDEPVLLDDDDRIVVIG